MSYALNTLNTFGTRLKPVLLAGLLAVGAAGALAQSPPPGTSGDAGATQAQPQTAAQAHRGMRYDQRDPAKMQQFIAKRQADLKAKLKIEPEQETAWTRFTEAVKPTPDAFKRRQEMRADLQKLATPERIDRMRTLRGERQARMDQRGDAVKAFYAALNAEQKKIFDSQPLMQGHGGHGGEHGPRHGSLHGGKPGAMHGNLPAPDKN